MTLSLICRTTRPSLLLASPASRVSLTTVFSSRHVSFSAIHRGPARSEQSRARGAWADRPNAYSDGAKQTTYAERRDARERLAEQRPTYKIRKGKKDITEYPDEAKPKSRRARFYDPDSPFGKKSLVYRAKAGELREEVESPQGRDRQRFSDSAFERSGPRPDLRDRPRRTAGSRASGRGSRVSRDADDVLDVAAELRRDAGPPRSDTTNFRREASFPRRETGSPSRDTFTPRGGFNTARRDRDTARRDRDTPRSDSFGFRTARDTTRTEDKDTFRRDESVLRRDPPRREDRDTFRRDESVLRRDAPRREHRDSFRADSSAFRRPRDTSGPRNAPTVPRKDRDPISIPYTTAASQFLYGKAVVEAALRSTRRKLYKLYIYGGANRQNVSDDALLQGLAKRKGVPVTVVGEDGLRMMDKMASSRPHNGFVLEASPLPQPPVTALGPVAENYAAEPGYPVTLGHQSAEEAAVNGTPTFIRAPSATHKPLVVVLDQILDPGNLGAILRSVSFLGATAVGIARHGSATLTPVALKASAGAAEALQLFSIASMPQFVMNSRANGWSVYAAVANEGPRSGVKQRRHVSLRDVEDADPLRTEPCVLLLGNEGEGLDRLLVKKADYELNIPNLSGSTAVDSLNVSVAAGLLCSAFMRGVVKEQENAEAGSELKATLW